MSRAQFLVALLVSALVALPPLMLVAWIMSGSWSPGYVHWLHLLLVFPTFLAVNLGLGHMAALLASFLTYWAIAFALLTWYIRSTGLETRAARNPKSGA